MKPQRLFGALCVVAVLTLGFLAALRREQYAPAKPRDSATGFKNETIDQPTNQSALLDASTMSAQGNEAVRVADLHPSAPNPPINPVTEPQFAAFEQWLRRFEQADELAKKTLEAEGIILAQQRLTALADLIQKNPQRALELSVPFAMRELVPESVRAHFEERVNARGDLAVIAALSDGPSSLVPPLMRTATIDGKEYQAFTYGDGLRFMTKKDVPLNGIAVPNDVSTKPYRTIFGKKEKLLVVAPSPARVFDRDEVAALNRSRARARELEPVCSVSQMPVTWQNEETVVEFGGDLHSFCGKVDASWWANANIQAAGLDLPSPENPLTAESSYTEGRKRMFCMRPYWSNYAPVLSTNEAITRYVAFSNYMFQMSYGKLMLAPLGRGSDISPDMLLPGLVAEYDNTGLGKLYNTSRDVARTNYGYDLTQYDFIYVMTGSQPAAGYCGLAYVGAVGFHIPCWGADVTVHEFGHNLGLNHAHFWDTDSKSIIGSGQNVEYGDNNDPMGGGGDPNQYNSRYKNYLGWITNTEIATIPAAGINRYRLYCFDLDYSVGLRGLRFVRGSDNYWLNFRQRKTNKAALMNGVQLLWTGNGNQGSYLLDVRLKGDADNNAVVIGRTFSDTSLNFHFTPIGKGNTYPQSIDVVAVTGPQPGNLPPLASLAASTLTPNPGQAVAFTATASDPNGDTLAYYWQFGDGAESYSSDNKPTQTHSFTTAGEYAVRCVVSDMRGGTAEHTLIVRVGNPAAFRISGHVMDVSGKPVAGALVSAGSKTVSVDSDGSYIIPGLTAGSYTVSALEPVYGAVELIHPFFSNPVTLGPNAQNIDFVVGTSAPPVTLVATGAVWKYFDKGVDPGANWQSASFSDVTWSNGPSQFGYGESDESTVISFGPSSANKYPAYYFRTTFNVANPAALTNAVLNVLRDDGAIVYLNGVEVFRNNMPAGPVTYTMYAAANAGDDGDTWFPTNISSSLLIAGANVLAAEVHQDTAGSSDVTFDLTLVAESVTNVTRGALVYINSPADNAVFAGPTNINVIASAFSTPATVASVEIYDSASQLGVAASPPYSALLSNPSAGLHALRAVSVDSGGIRRTSAPVNITVTAPAARDCTLTSPANGSSFSLPANVTLAANATAGGALTVTNVQFYSDDVLIGQDVTSPFSLVWSNPPTGAHLIVAVAYDSAGASFTSTPVSITVSATPAGDALISFGDVWKYSDDGSNLGTSWTGSAYNDNQWSMGPGRLGYGGDGEITAVSYGANVNFKYITTYFRKKFVVANPAAFSSLLMRLIRDDGAAVYINGIEVYRTNLLAGPVSYNSLALTPISGAGETSPLDVPLGSASLVAGTNTIAVEMHQDSITSTDLGFDLALIGLHDTNITDGSYITAPAEGTHYNMPASVSLAAYASSSSGAITLVEYYDGPAKVGQALSAPYAASWSGAAVGTHALTAVATVTGGQMMTSPPVSIVVGPAPPPIAPVFRQIIIYGAQWKYWDSASTVSNGWRDLGFDDSDWSSGNGRFGWGLDSESTLLTTRVTHYFRKTFVLNNANTLDSLTFNMVRDDGVVVYLNGTEVFRTNMPVGSVNGSTLAASTINTPDETVPVIYTFPASGSGLLHGTNIVAVELHQSSATSSDGGFDLSFYGEGTTEGRVYIGSPVQNSTHVTGMHIDFTAHAQAAAGRTVSSVEFFGDGTNFAQASSVPYRVTWPSATAGTHTIVARAIDDLGNSITSPPVQIGVGYPLTSLVLIPSNSVWKYLDNGSSQGTNWSQPNFDDALWAAGGARLGYGGDGEETTVSYGPNVNAKWTNTYFRRTFVVPPDTFITNLTFRLVRDDGAVVWVNGREAYRSNMPGGVITSTTFASATVNPPDETTFFVTALGTTNVHPGTNVIGVEVHQITANSSDLGFDLELDGDGYMISSGPAAPVLAATVAGAQFQIAWPTSAVGYQLYSSPEIGPAAFWQLVNDAPLISNSLNVLIIPTTNAAAFYRLEKP